MIGSSVEMVRLLRSRATLLAAILLGALVWSYWPALSVMWSRWLDDPRYAHGVLVPLFALALLWMRRGRLADVELRPTSWGLLLVGAGAALRLVGGFLYVEWLDAISLLPALAGVCLLVGGRPALAWAWPAVAFLAFMVPLPFRVELAMGWPLQRLATEAGAYALQTLGLPALAEGNVIHLDDFELGVVEACSGLSMLILFFAIATGLTMVIRRPPIDKALIIASAVPIALISNIARIVVTGVLHQVASDKVADAFFHDLAGWLMMPLALALLFGEIALLDRLLVEVEREEFRPVGLATARAASRDAAAVDGSRKKRRPVGPVGPAFQSPRS